jgi:VWFA-related protein
MVLVDAVVKNRNGRMIDNLKKDDFKVYEDGVLQELQSFSFDELPLAVAVVVDRSGSVAPYISELRRIATRALQQLKPVDQVALFSFAGSVDRIESLTTDRERIAQSIARIQAGGGTNINDALFEAASYLGKAAPDRRHAIILVSDNQPTVNPRASDGEVIREAMEADTVIYSIKTQGITDPLTIDLPSLILGGDGVNKIARETGGEVLKASGVSSLDNVLGSVISRLRMRYSLGYYPSNTSQGGAFHAIMVRLDERHGKPGTDYFVHARRGYYSTSGRLR